MCLGEYGIQVTYFGQHVTGSPFTAKAWDMNKVNVSNICQGRVGLQSSFNSKSTSLSFAANSVISQLPNKFMDILQHY